jgi:RNA polymerase sigma factor (sigma-70 family)
MGKEATQLLVEAEELLSRLNRQGARPSDQLKLEVETISRRLLLRLQQTAQRHFFNAFYRLSLPLFHVYAGWIIRKYGYPIDAQDVLQRMYLLLYEKLLAPRGHVPLDYLFPWCYKVMRNVAREEVRELNRSTRLAEESTGIPAAPSSLELLIRTESESHARDRLEQVQDLLLSPASGLRARDREIMRFFYYEGRSMREISALTGLSMGHVGVILMRARKRMARLLA